MTIGQYQRHLNQFPNGNLGASITLDFHVNGIYQSGILNSVNCVLTFLPPRVHSTIWLELIQDSTGGRTVSFPITVIGTIPPINLAANSSTVIEMLWNGTSYQFTSNTGASQTSLSYSNLNGISFGIAGSTLTASYTVPSTAGLISNINISAGTTSNNLSALTLSNSNGLSFGLNGSTITGSYTVPIQTNQTAGFYALGNTTQNSSTTLDVRTLSFNGLGGNTVGYSNGSIQISGVTTAGLISGINVSAGTTSNNLSALTFSNSNGVSFGLSGSTLTASVGAAPGQTNQTEGFYAVGNTIGQSSSSTFDARTLSFSGAGVASVGYSAGNLIISVPSGIANINVSAGTTSNNLTNFVFSNSNNVSFGLNGSTITASTPIQTNQSIGLYALGNTTQNSSTTLDARSLSFNGLGIITAGYSNGSIQISATQSVQTQSNIQGISAGTQLGQTGNVIFSNSNGISFGMSNSSIITASYTVPSIAGLISGVNVSAGTTSNNLTNFVFSNSNNLSFGLNGSTITGSIAAQSNQTVGGYVNGVTIGQSSSTTYDARSMSVSIKGWAFGGYSAGQLQISVPTPTINVSAGTTSNNDIAIVFSNSNNVSFGKNGVQITASFSQTPFTISGGTSSNTGNGITFINSNNMSFTNNAGVIAAKAAPKESEIVNDSNVSGTSGADALNTLDTEITNLNKQYASVVTTSLSTVTLGLTNVKGLFLTSGTAGAPTAFTVPNNSTVAFLVGSQIDFIALNANNFTITGASGVTIRTPVGNLAATNSLYHLICIDINVWELTQTPVDSSHLTNTSDVPGATVTDALNTIQTRGYADRTRFVRTDLAVGTSSLTMLSAIQQTITIGSPANRQKMILALGVKASSAALSYALMNDGTSPTNVNNFSTGPIPTCAAACDASGTIFFGYSDGTVQSTANSFASVTTVLGLPSGTYTWVGFTSSHYLIYDDSIKAMYQSTSLTGTWTAYSVPGYVTGMATNGTGTWVIFTYSSTASTILYSTNDGVSFTTALTFSASSDKISGAWCEGLQKFVMLEQLLGSFWTSPDGITWTLYKSVSALSGITFSQQSVASCGSVVACVVNRGPNSIGKYAYGIAYTLDLGITWFEEYIGDTNGANPITSLISANGRFYVLDGKALYQSGVLSPPPALYNGV